MLLPDKRVRNRDHPCLKCHGGKDQRLPQRNSCNRANWGDEQIGNPLMRLLLCIHPKR